MEEGEGGFFQVQEVIDHVHVSYEIECESVTQMLTCLPNEWIRPKFFIHQYCNYLERRLTSDRPSKNEEMDKRQYMIVSTGLITILGLVAFEKCIYVESKS